MKAIDIITDMKFNDPADILNYFKNHNIPIKVDPDTKKHIYAVNPETKRSITYEVREADGLLYLTKE